MDKKVSIIQTGIKYGLITAVVSLIYSVISFQTGLFLNFFLSIFIIILITAFMLVFAMREFKKDSNGYLSIGQGILVGLVTVIISSIIVQPFNFIYMNYIDTTIIPQMIDKITEVMERFDLPEDKIEEAIEKTQKDATSFTSLFSNLLVFAIIGLIISLIIAAIMKKKPSEFDSIDAK
jgi:predicted PurR-regulated permease PerM